VIILDTDHVVVLKYPGNPRHTLLLANMNASTDQDFATSAVTIEEQMRGWLGLIHRSADVHEQVTPYERLVELFDFFSRWKIVHFDERAADEFKRLRKEKTRIGSMDLKIATIALVHEALLLSANLRDFERVPGLRVEDWLR
jgi:tRNA(fMet)-specific endonuclease VapC